MQFRPSPRPRSFLPCVLVLGHASGNSINGKRVPHTIKERLTPCYHLLDFVMLTFFPYFTILMTRITGAKGAISTIVILLS